mgnify:FL=1
MQILTLENKTFVMNDLPEEVEDLRFAVLDNSNPKEPDYFFIPLIFLQSFNAPALVLKIGKHTIRMPRDWQMLIGESEVGDLEVVPLTSLNDRGFNAFTFNPRGQFRPEFYPVEIVDVYQEVKWYFPKLKPGHLLAVPLCEGENPPCAYFVEDISRTSEIVDVAKIW